MEAFWWTRRRKSESVNMGCHTWFAFLLTWSLYQLQLFKNTDGKCCWQVLSSVTRQPSCVMETGLVLGSRTEIEPHTERVDIDPYFRQTLQTLPFAIIKSQDMQIGIKRIRRTHTHQKWKTTTKVPFRGKKLPEKWESLSHFLFL